MLSGALPAMSANVMLGIDLVLPTLGNLAPFINLAIDVALAALLFYILLTARKGR